MCAYFSDKTEEAIQLLYGQYDQAEFRRARQLLTQAADEGDADALHFLSRSISQGFIWAYTGIPQDLETAVNLMQKSVLQGSACGVLGALRLRGAFTPVLREQMPFSSLREAFDIVLKKAEGGHSFCQYMIGNAYFWGDMQEIEGLDDMEAARRDAEWNAEAMQWFEKAILGGCHWAAINLLNYYEKGANGVPQDMEKYNYWLKYCADAGSPEEQNRLGDDLYKKKEYELALRYYEQSAKLGQMEAWYSVGYQYQMGQGVAKDERYALTCYEKGAQAGMPTAQYAAGTMYYTGKGCDLDYARAYYYFDLAVQQGKKDAVPYLGECYLKGLGVERDYAKAKSLFEKTQDKVMSLNGLGDIYTEGKGVPEDIKTGVSYYQKAAGLGSQIGTGNVARFKKGLLGNWKRR